ncbi:MAG: class I SAM-dependent methyltransferase [Candidatus Micrarchaeales archaeon]|jgi:ubiquinone/menaquinone biosynthesis C-methylase UbiE
MGEVEYWTNAYSGTTVKLEKDGKEKSWKVGSDPEKLFLLRVKRNLNGNETFLDIGCGIGKTLKLVANRTREAIGVDIAPKLIKDAKRTAPSNVHFTVANAIELPFKANTFDIITEQRGPITSIEQQGGIATSERIAKEMFRVLKEKGVFFAIGIGERDKENIKRVFGRGQFYEYLIDGRKRSEEMAGMLNKIGFSKMKVKEYDTLEYFATFDDLVLRLSGRPIIPNFNMDEDKEHWAYIQKQFSENKGIRTNSHRFILRATK